MVKIRQSALLAFLVIFISLFSFMPLCNSGYNRGLLGNTQLSITSISPIQNIYAANNAGSQASSNAKASLDSYRSFLEQPDLYPKLSAATGVFALIMKAVSFILACCGMIFIIILALRVGFDLVIVAMGWEPDDEISGFKGLIFGLSSFGKLINSDETGNFNKRTRNKWKGAKKFEVPDTIGDYFKEFWINIAVSLIAAGLMITGQVYPVISKCLGMAYYGIDMIMNLDFDGSSSVGLNDASGGNSGNSGNANGNATQTKN